MDDARQKEAVVESTIRIIKAAAIEVYNEVEPGRGDHIYDACFRKELGYQQIPFVKTSSMPFFYKGERIDELFSASIFLIINNAVLVEINGFENLVLYKQDTMKANLKQVGLTSAMVLNFNVGDSGNIFKRINLKA